MRVWSCGCTLPTLDFGQRLCFTHSLNPRVLYEVLGLLASVCSEHFEADTKAPAFVGGMRAKLQLATYQLVATSICRNSTKVLRGVATADMTLYCILISPGPLRRPTKLHYCFAPNTRYERAWGVGASMPMHIRTWCGLM